MGSALLCFGKIWMNLTGLFQGNSCFCVLLLCSVRRSKESSLFGGWRSVSLHYRIADITVPQFLFSRRDKTKSMTPRIISVSGAASVQTCLVLGLPFAQINLSIRDLSCASSHSPQASLFFLPWWIILQHTHINFKRALVGVTIFIHIFFVLSWSLKIFSEFAGGCVHVRAYLSSKSRLSQALILQTLQTWI